MVWVFRWRSAILTKHSPYCYTVIAVMKTYEGDDRASQIPFLYSQYIFFTFFYGQCIANNSKNENKKLQTKYKSSGSRGKSHPVPALQLFLDSGFFLDATHKNNFVITHVCCTFLNQTQQTKTMYTISRMNINIHSRLPLSSW